MKFIKNFFKKKDEIIYKPMKKGVSEDLANFEKLVLGGTRAGKTPKPWDNLKPCICSEKPLLLYNKTNHLNFVVCPNCGNHTKHGELMEVIELWNSDECTLHPM